MAVFKRRGKWAVTTYDPETQGKHWVGTYETKREAQAAERQALAAHRPPSGQQITVDEFVSRWTTNYPRHRESTNVVNRQAVSRLARDFAGRKLDEIDRREARSWILQNRHRLAAIRAMFNDAVKDGLCETNPFAGLRLPESRGRKDLIVPTEAELRALCDTARKLHSGGWGENILANWIMFAAYSGLRPGEAGGLRWADIDFEGEPIRVERQLQHHSPKEAPPKFGSRRTIHLTPPAALALSKVPKVRTEIFTTPRGGLFSGKSQSLYFKPVAASIGRPDLTPHCLRHYFGTELAAEALRRTTSP